MRYPESDTFADRQPDALGNAIAVAVDDALTDAVRVTNAVRDAITYSRADFDPDADAGAESYTYGQSLADAAAPGIR